MTTELVDLFNITMTELNQPLLVSEDDTGSAAELARVQWPAFRKRMLFDHRPYGVTRNVPLSVIDPSDPSSVFFVADPTTIRWRFQYDLPVDIIRPMGINLRENQPSGQPWEIGSPEQLNYNVLFTDATPAVLTYVYDMGNQVHLLGDQLFYAWGLMFALQLARRLSATPQDISQTGAKATIALEAAMASEGQARSGDTMATTPLQYSRTGGSRYLSARRG